MTKPKSVNKAPKTLKAKAPPPAPRFTSVAKVPVGASPAGWHKIESYLHCPTKYKLTHLWKIRRPQWQTPDPLAVGQLFHVGRAWWFDQKFPTGADAWAALQDHVREAALLNPLPVREDAINRTLNYLDQYCTYWSHRAKPTVVATEYALSGAVPGIIEPRTARLDDISSYPEANFKLAIGECKTTSVSIKDCIQEYTLHGQPTLQQILWDISPEGKDKHGPVEFVLLDIIVKGYGKEKCEFGRHAVRITPYTQAWFTESLAFAVDQSSKMTKETKTERRITSCTRLIGRMRVDCEYKDLCQRGQSAAVAYVDDTGTSIAKYAKEKGPKPWDI